MSENKETMSVWDSVKHTDPAYTKPFSAPGGHSGTAISGTYMVMKATELWGPIGGNWGYSIVEERVDTGGPIYNEAGEILGNEMTHTMRLKLWVKEGEITREVEHFGHTPYIYYSKKWKNFITDGEAPKKSLTDAIKKCLSMFGFCADIYLGLYDDVAYVELAKEAAELEKSDDAVAEAIKQRQMYEEWLAKHLELVATATSINELELLFKTCVRKAKHHEDNAAITAFTKAKDKRKKELTEKESA